MYLPQSLKSSKKSFFLFALWGILALVLIEKGSVVLGISQLHNGILDLIFFILTHFGDLPVLLPALLLMFFIMPFSWQEKKNIFFKILIALTAMFVVVVVLKQVVFDYDRPGLYFQKIGISLPQISGMRMHNHHSFPSGHSATAFFAWYIWFNLMFPNNSVKNLWIIPAILVAFSRVYLGQHFFQDIWAGAFIGYVFALSLMWWISKSSPRFLHKKSSRKLELSSMY